MRTIFPVLILMIAASGTSCSGAETRALWVWETGKIIRSEGTDDKLIDFCKLKNTNVIFLYSGQELFKKDTDKEAIRLLIKKAHEANIEVHGLDGWPEAVYEENQKEFLSSLSTLLKFNATAEKGERFDGFQSDVEPYNLPEFKASQEGRKKIELLFVELHGKCRSIAGEKFKLGLAISERYSHEDSSVPAAMLKVMDYLAVMAYRNKAERIIKSSEYFVDLASSMDRKIWVGVETGNPGNEPASISFYGKREKAMEEELSNVSKQFKDKKSFSGIAIHSYKSYAAMNPGN